MSGKIRQIRLRQGVSPGPKTGAKAMGRAGLALIYLQEN
jgi:hypothetical protein